MTWLLIAPLLETNFKKLQRVLMGLKITIQGETILIPKEEKENLLEIIKKEIFEGEEIEVEVLAIG